jgi:Ca-activated chloride channel family protein
MKMVIGERVIIAEIKEKQKAKKEYEQAKKEGKTASLLQQHRPNVFQMSVANILPGDTIVVEMSYTEILVPEEGTYEFVYPAVVGPRYTDSTGIEKDPWANNPYTEEKTVDKMSHTHSFDINVNLQCGMPVSQIKSISHEAIIDFTNKNEATIGLKNSDMYEGDRDFILQFRLAGNKIESGLLLYEGKEENFFLMMVQPPSRIIPEDIPPREYIFIIDVSGSMRGFPIDITKVLMRNLISNLKPSDKFNVLLFASSSAVLSSNSLLANEENINKAISFIDNESGRGGTELLSGLQRALDLPTDENFSKSVVIVTDGFVTVEKEAFDLIKNNLGKANFFSFGIGSNVNRYIIEGMARAGYGEPLIITNTNEANEKAEKFRKYIQSPILTGIDVEINGFEAFDMQPTTYPDMFAEKPLIVFGKWKGKPHGEISIKGKDGTNSFLSKIKISNYHPDDSNDALRYLWARHKIMVLSDYNRLLSEDSELVEEITRLGLKYNLLTDYTSFVAIDQEIRIKDVANSGSVPEPHEWLFIIIILGFLSFLLIKKFKDKQKIA